MLHIDDFVCDKPKLAAARNLHLVCDEFPYTTLSEFKE
jgi:hypothetical protein